MIDDLGRRRSSKGVGAGLFLPGLQMQFPLPLWARSEEWGLQASPATGHMPMQKNTREEVRETLW